MLGTRLFPGGIHPKEGANGKAVTAMMSIAQIDAPPRVIIPLSQHIGRPAKCVVKKGDHVKMGQLIGEADGPISASVHSSVSGKVVSVGQCLLANGQLSDAVIIDNNFKDDFAKLETPANPEAITQAELCGYIRAAGIVGLGGATFPTAIKFAPPQGMKIDTLIINGAECEPYLSADHRLMLEDAARVIDGIQIALKALGVQKAIIGVETNKPDAIDALKNAIGSANITVKALPVHYPQGGEKQLIYALTKKRVPNGALPIAVGMVVCNVGTMAAISYAIKDGMPLIERIVTVGGMFEAPANFRVRIGTPVEKLMEAAGGIQKKAKQLIYGGPMMGAAISRSDIPVVKGCSGIVALENPCMERLESQCIRCGRCLTVCPMQLVPTTIDQFVRADDYGSAKKLGVLNCIECGSCVYVCPAKRSLVQSFRVGKRMIADIAAKERAQLEKEKQQQAQKEG